jgi:RNA polymerase sigma-70 factor (ECF subfamily)
VTLGAGRYARPVLTPSPETLLDGRLVTVERADDRADWSSILEQVCAGSPAAFEQVYAHLAPTVASYLRMSAVSDVEGVTNEVFLQVHRGLARFTGEWQAFRSWVFTIAHHRMVDETRRAARRPRLVPLDAELDGPSGDAELDALDSLADERLGEVLGQLSADQRAVLLLRIVADLPIEDVARSLGKTNGAVKSLQHRALATLRRSLELQGAEP